MLVHTLNKNSFYSLSSSCSLFFCPVFFFFLKSFYAFTVERSRQTPFFLSPFSSAIYLKCLSSFSLKCFFTVFYC
ncbi:hypothetical protein GHT06_018013 [Daphnia sinensis]|uniref:Uncharacterized protein n=1 Tax=Daphnia sinensis TaxID=1820382 RepID=A0AAD5LD52_9CRUS|nr:hypothetical protein GHT06_018013 [Daphnia sinensis]